MTPHLVLMQYGDYGATWRRLQQGLPETYRDQKASVDFVASLAPRFRVTTLAICDRPHHETLAPNLWSVGITPQIAFRFWRLWPVLEGLAPDRLILRTPHLAALTWARMRGTATLPVFADIFAHGSMRRQITNKALAWALSGRNVPCVSNHSLNASVSLQQVLNLPAKRILPWDRKTLQVDPPPKPPQTPGQPFTAFYAGLVTHSKGIGDCLAAVALLAAQGTRLRLELAGTGDLTFWQAEAATLGLTDQVTFLGNLPNAEVRHKMRQADLVLVPSRHDYAEGLPNTLCEALSTRTPVLVSDHPAFASRLRPDIDCLMFRAADPKDLARQIQRLIQGPDLQRSLSDQSEETLERLHYGMDWFDLLQSYAEDPQNTTGWIEQNSLSRRQELSAP